MSASSTENNPQPKFVIFPRVENVEVSSQTQQPASDTSKVVLKRTKVRRIRKRCSSQASAETLMAQASPSSAPSSVNGATATETTSNSTLMQSRTCVSSEGANGSEAASGSEAVSDNSEAASDNSEAASGNSKGASGSEAASGNSEAVSDNSEGASGSEASCSSKVTSSMSEDGSRRLNSVVMTASEGCLGKETSEGDYCVSTKSTVEKMTESGSVEELAKPKLTKAEIAEALHINPSLLSNVELEQIISVFFEHGEKLRALLNKTEPLLLKVKGDKVLTKSVYLKYLTDVAPQLNLVFATLKEWTFNSVEDAHITFNLIIRSYVAGFCVHVKQTRPRSDGLVTTRMECHTSSHHGTGNATQESPKCEWKVQLKETEKSIFRITDVSDFLAHKTHCIEKWGRLTPVEVKHQKGLKVSTRQEMMGMLKQSPVSEDTVRKQKYRLIMHVKEKLLQQLLTQIKNKQPDLSLTNLKAMSPETNTISEETMSMIKYLSLEKDKGLLSKMVFRGDGEQGVVWCATHLMWEGGQTLLKTHSDVIFCDSMWNVSKEKDRLLTIVVIDSHYKLKLAAMSLVHQEREQEWENLFLWVKQCVPSFSPKCVVTDGASYIMSGFNNVIPCGVQNIVCWWHQSKNCEKSKGKDKILKSILLSISYSEKAEDIDKAVALFKEKLLEFHPRNSALLNATLIKNVASALISLKVFTGNTITNSYAESVNAQLRRFGIIDKGTRLYQLTLLHHFIASKYQKNYSTFDPEPLQGLFESEVFQRVTNGVLVVMVNKLKDARETCKVIEAIDSVYKVCQLLSFELNNHILKKKTFWKVSWSTTTITCTCNALVYGGVPCLHVLAVAQEKSRKIPLFCFHPRFVLQAPDVTELNRADELPDPASVEAVAADTHAIYETNAALEANAPIGPGTLNETGTTCETNPTVHSNIIAGHDILTETEATVSSEFRDVAAQTSANATPSQHPNLFVVSTTPDEIHSMDMLLSAKYTSHNACYARGAVQAMSILFLRALERGVPLECVTRHIQSTLQQVNAKAQEWDREFGSQNVGMPHTLIGGPPQPYRPLSAAVRTRCNQRLQQIVSSGQCPEVVLPNLSEESGEPPRQRPRTA